MNSSPKTVDKKFHGRKFASPSAFIDGNWVPAASGKTFDTIHPATEEVIAQVVEGDKADIDLR